MLGPDHAGPHARSGAGAEDVGSERVQVHEAGATSGEDIREPSHLGRAHGAPDLGQGVDADAAAGDHVEAGLLEEAHEPLVRSEDHDGLAHVRQRSGGQVHEHALGAPDLARDHDVHDLQVHQAPASAAR